MRDGRPIQRRYSQRRAYNEQPIVTGMLGTGTSFWSVIFTTACELTHPFFTRLVRLAFSGIVSLYFWGVALLCSTPGVTCWPAIGPGIQKAATQHNRKDRSNPIRAHGILLRPLNWRASSGL